MTATIDNDFYTNSHYIFNDITYLSHNMNSYGTYNIYKNGNITLKKPFF